MINVTGKIFTINGMPEIVSAYNNFTALIKKILNKNKMLLSNNYKTYEKLTNLLSELKLQEKLNIEELIDFYIKTTYFIKNYNKLLIKLEKLTAKGFLDKFVIDYDKILYIQLLLPSDLDYKTAIEKSTIKKEKLSDLLLAKKCYDLIVVLKYEHIARDLRREISITVKQQKNYFSLYHIQRHGIYPVGNYIKMQPDKDATIINLEIPNPIVYNINNLKIVYNRIEGISENYIKNVVQPMFLPTSGKIHTDFIVKNPDKLYETFDGVYFRELCGDPRNFYNGPSAIANGYNTRFNTFIKNKQQKPYNNKVLLTLIKQNSIAVYSDLVRKLTNYVSGNTNNTEIIKQEIFKIIHMFLKTKLCTEENKGIINREVELGINNELFRLKKQFKKISITEFLDFLKNDKSNIIALINQKKKIFEFFN